MPKTKMKQTLIVFSAQEVWDALRKTYPEAGLPTEIDLTDDGEDATGMAAVSDTDADVPSDFVDLDGDCATVFVEDSGIIVRFTPGRSSEKGEV